MRDLRDETIGTQRSAAGWAADPDARWRWQELLWLAYLPLILVNAALNDTTAVEWALLVASIALIAVLVTRAVRGMEHSLLMLSAFTLGLGLLLAPSRMAAVILLAYAAGAAGHVRPTALALSLIAGVVVAATIEAWVLQSAVLFAFGAVLASFVGLVNLHVANYRRANESLRRANAEIERLAAVAERERIARDLHDVMGHTLSLIALKSELAARLAEATAPAAAAESRDIQAASRAALAEIREVVRGYRSRLADEVGRARALLEAARIDARITVAAGDLPAEADAVLALALREGATNVVRHARATQCGIRFGLVDNTLLLEIDDDGIGVTTAEGSGLEGMRERVRAIGGRVELASVSGATTLRVAIPMPMDPPRTIATAGDATPSPATARATPA